MNLEHHLFGTDKEIYLSKRLRVELGEAILTLASRAAKGQYKVLTLFRMEGGGEAPPPFQVFLCSFYKRRN